MYRKTPVGGRAAIRRRAVLGLVLAAAAVLHADGVRAEWVKREAAILGTAVTVELWHDDRAAADRAADAVLAEMRRVDALMSTYKPESVLSVVNARAAAEPVAVPAELAGLIALSLEYSQRTEGAFDITYASVGYLYDYRAGVKPEDEVLAEALPAVNWRHVHLDQDKGTVRFAQPGVRIDLGGIAKGHAVDRAIDLLRERGVEHALVTAGGDTRLLGDRRGAPWMVGVRDPRVEGRVFLRLPMEDEAISTSGDYERYFEADGQRYHHILEPGSGKPASSVYSVTVIGPQAVDTDALSTSVFVLGVERGLALIERLEAFEAVIVDARGAVHYSSGLTAP
ncbi:MAG TPA: FAD:protein FMN transferase [Steroidobacteraceae bacterium]|nr:FAD:protein FMN transferase [Steroidobacteraceae bacterium]